MKKLATLFICAALTLPVMGCTPKRVPLLPPEQAVEYAGELGDVEGTLRKYLSTVLIDPESLRLEIIYGPKPAAFTGKDQKPIYCWRVVAHINAKNRYGGYTGGKVQLYFIQKDRVIAECQFLNFFGKADYEAIPGSDLMCHQVTPAIFGENSKEK